MISPKKIFEQVQKSVVGQEDAIKTVSTGLFTHLVKYFKHTQDNKPMKKVVLLLMGPSGSGKTLIVREAAKALRDMLGYEELFPVLEVDCTELSSRGWEGDNLSDCLKTHKRTCKTDAEWNTTIVFLDEFDKLCKPAIGKGGTDHNKSTQYNLLKMIEGAPLDKGPGAFSTENILFILAGNFSEVRAAREVKSSHIGFTEAPEEKPLDDLQSELENIGMATQLVGRLTHVGEIFPLEAGDLRRILMEHALPEISELYNYLDQELLVPESVLNRIVESSLKRGTGARGIYADLCKETEETMFESHLEI